MEYLVFTPVPGRYFPLQVTSDFRCDLNPTQLHFDTDVVRENCDASYCSYRLVWRDGEGEGHPLSTERESTGAREVHNGVRGEREGL